MAKVESGVFPCYENQFAVGKAGTESATTNIANCEEFSVAFDNGVEEWTAFEGLEVKAYDSKVNHNFGKGQAYNR